MSVHRVMGLETEYGVLAPNAPRANSTVLSARIVNAYADVVRAEGGELAGTPWDYSDETPLIDARGWKVRRSEADPTQLTDAPRELTAEEIALIDAVPQNALYDVDARSARSSSRAADHLGDAMYREEPESTNDAGGRLGSDHVVMNMVLGNGARLYVDHAHPEYSSPEVSNPLDAVIWDQAGDRVVLAAMQRIAAENDGEVLLYKNNTDNKGVSYGAHENYLMPRATDFNAIAAGLLPFFATRQVVCGAGRVGLGMTGNETGFQISQRADFFEAEVGLETTIRRPLVNTRDEPHAVWEKYRRLHVIAGDANLGQVSTYLRVGTTALVLSLIEAGRAPAIALADPVSAVARISHDPGLRTVVELADGRRLTALEVQEIYLDAATAWCAETGSGSADPQTRDVLHRWRATLDGLRSDVSSMASTVDWVAKHQLMNQYRDRHGIGWSDPRIAAMDLQWADLRPEKGLFRRLEARGRVERLVSEERIASAVVVPPEDTRAYVRGRSLERYRQHVVGANWDSVVFAVPGRRGVKRIPLLEPARGTRRDIGALFDAQLDIAEFVDQLAAQDRPSA
ncbi:proteasome accessory factor A [Zhihengliuella halotolerans]|uniref:Proteasome accessory factor A n=2 Tax=Zhihengliuella halotolerans TaxID=370736 RepID=A0A4Q8ABD1_9MICC|nr:proteasome accessory factor A [Zhihengliuella halotolerans]